ncbi:vesicle coat component [Tieghemiomyces parasiticus]|uniref:Vesicle coat component n=1 Tax=Tieghemiomyces parasiticus TaxID=78921 RepID=A0A9W7ZNR8_9FUNG|nr:vesicle coat component [Tieghemiomyces parasiticus]
MRFSLLTAGLAFLGATAVLAIKFKLPGQPEAVQDEKCISAWGEKDKPVKVKIRAAPEYNQRLNVRVYDSSAASNTYATRSNVVDETVIEFQTHDHAELFVCMRNILDPGYQPDGRARLITFSMDIGASAVDYKELAARDKLKPVEAELIKLERYLTQIDEDLAYMKWREQNLRNTNESTNDRVKFFNVLSLVVMAMSGLWQIYYLRRFFQQKKLI